MHAVLLSSVLRAYRLTSLLLSTLKSSGVFVHLDIKQYGNLKTFWEAHGLTGLFAYYAPVRQLPQYGVLALQRGGHSWKVRNM